MNKLTLVLMTWNTSHLLGRTLETLCNQTIGDGWDLLVIDDKSDDDVQVVLDPFVDRLPITYVRLEHDMGMRGNTFAINYGIEWADSNVVMWSTPEVMLPPGALDAAYSTVMTDLFTPKFVTIPSHGLTHRLQMEIDDSMWQEDIHNIKELVAQVPPNAFESKWFYLNFYHDGRVDLGTKRKSYGNNQTVAVNKGIWMDKIGKFPYFLDYGSDDPWISGERRKKGYKDITLWEHEGYHQWHTKCQYWMAQGKAPNWNKWGHTMSNILNDPKVPSGGTCKIWDGGRHDQMTEAEIESALCQRDLVESSGFQAK